MISRDLSSFIKSKLLISTYSLSTCLVSWTSLRLKKYIVSTEYPGQQVVLMSCIFETCPSVVMQAKVFLVRTGVFFKRGPMVIVANALCILISVI